MDLTPSQQAAAELRGRPLLVSAGAGAGKTRVLVERLMSYLTAPEGGHSIDRFLLITYTRAAAAEMRERILAALREKLAGQPERLLRQTALAHTAWICTLHSYCLEIYREHHAAAGLDADDVLPPDLRMGDETELALLRMEALDDTLEAWFEQQDGGPGQAALTDMGVNQRGDRRLGELIYTVWEKTRAYETADWEHHCLDITRREVWEPALVERARRELALWLERLAALQAHVGDDLKRGVLLSAIGSEISGILSKPQTWDALRAQIAQIPLLPYRAGRDQDPVDAVLQALRKRLEALRSTFADSAEDGEEDAQAALPAARALLDAAQSFDTRYSNAKAGRGLMDYHDLERFALRVLSDKDGNPSAIARKLSRRFTEIFVDEYQDINPLQDRIIHLLSREGRNVFRVGDVRQSIYRFQNADPGLFLDKYERFARWPDLGAEGAGVTVPLPDNFRSRPEILDAVNFVFARLMAHGSGEAAYEPLRPGRTSYEPDALAGVEWLVTDLSASEDEDETPLPQEDSLTLEARTVARRLYGLIHAGEAKPEDCVILLRSPRERAHHYRAALAELGIESREREDGADWLQSPELTALIAMLTVADNPLQDTALVAMLRAPGYGYTASALAAVRRARPRGTLYDGLKALDTEQAKRVLADLREWRVLASEWPVWRLAARIAARGELERLTGGQAGGRLDAFIELCKSAPLGLSLPGFLRWLAALREGKPGVSPAASPRGAVRIMSIHAAKGLEFPVVVLAALHKEFNLRDTHNAALTHSTGLALVRRDGWEEYPTPPHRLIAQRLVWEQKAEEQRLLYVAMTRAERLLILSHAEKSPSHWRERLTSGAIKTLPAEGLAQEGKSYAEWLTWFGRWQWTIDNGQLTMDNERGTMGGDAPIGGPAVKSKSAENTPKNCQLSIVNCQLPSKMTFGELKGRAVDFEVLEDTDTPPVPRGADYRLPSFVRADTDALSPAERGAAVHLALRWADLDACVTLDAAREELGRLAGRFTPAQLRCIDPGALHRLAVSPLGRRMRDAEKIYRECKFSFLEEAADLLPLENPEPGEKILLQGVIDCFFFEGGRWTVVDYKTDRDPRPEDHQPQLDFYVRAVKRITGAEDVDGELYYWRG